MVLRKITSSIVTCLIGSLLLFYSEYGWAQQPSTQRQISSPHLPAFPVPKPAVFDILSVNPSFGFPAGMPVWGNPSVPVPSVANMGNTESVQRFIQMQQLVVEIERESLQYIYDFPNRNQIQPGSEHYEQAFNDMQDMLQGYKTLSLSDAVFLVENAFFEGQLSREVFDVALDHYVEFTLRWLDEQGLDTSSPNARLYGLQQLFSDTLEVTNPGMETVQIHYPFDYDFDDFLGHEEFTNQFVTKLLATGSGQCYSLPTLFLLIAEQLDVDAYLAFSPNHSFVRMKDENGHWYNFEATTGYLVSDAWVMGSGYVTADAIRSKIFLNPLDTRSIVAHKLADLALGYHHKYGNSPFVKKAAEASLEYLPNNIFAMMVRANYQTDLIDWLWNIRGNPHPSHFESDARIREILAERNDIYRRIDATGYQAMPEEAYRAWLESVAQEKEKQEQQRQYLRLLERPKQ